MLIVDKDEDEGRHLGDGDRLCVAVSYTLGLPRYARYDTLTNLITVASSYCVPHGSFIANISYMF